MATKHFEIGVGERGVTRTNGNVIENHPGSCFLTDFTNNQGMAN